MMMPAAPDMTGVLTPVGGGGVVYMMNGILWKCPQKLCVLASEGLFRRGVPQPQDRMCHGSHHQRVP